MNGGRKLNYEQDPWSHHSAFVFHLSIFPNQVVDYCQGNKRTMNGRAGTGGWGERKLPFGVAEAILKIRM
jgi:hypothetical protein